MDLSTISLSTKTLTIGFIMLIYASCSSIFNKLNFHYIHESSLCMIIGIVISLIVSLSSSNSSNNILKFDEEIFFNLILPPIIFAAGYNLRKRAFFQYFSYSSLFGILGTFINFIFISSFLYFLNKLNIFYKPHTNEESINNSNSNYLSLSVNNILTFTAIISATDSVAPLSFIKESEKPKLFAILFGEGVLNDAVCIVLYRIIKAYDNIDDSIVSASLSIDILMKFSYLFIASLMVGAFGGLSCAYFLKKMKKYQPSRTHENTFIILFAFITYSTAELLHLSPIIALLFTGIFMSQYAYLNLSFQSREESCIVAKILSNFAESFVFCYLGLSFMSIKWTYISYTFIIIVIIRIVLGRIFSVYSIGFLINILSCIGMSLEKSDKRTMSICGFIRGAIAYGLALTYTHKDISLQNTLITSVLIVVFTTTLITGIFLPFLLKTKKENGETIDDNEIFSFERFEKLEDYSDIERKNSLIDSNNGGESSGYLKNLWNRIDNRYIKPFFIDDWPNVKIEHLEITNKIVDIVTTHSRKRRSEEIELV